MTKRDKIILVKKTLKQREKKRYKNYTTKKQKDINKKQMNE